MDAPLPQNALGAQHVGFLVEDAAATKAELEAKGVRFFSDVNVVDEGVLAGWRWVYFSDPEGNALELVAGRLHPPGGAAGRHRRLPEAAREPGGVS